MIVFPKAKINLGLRIVRKRADGYHDIETIFYPTGLCDALEFVVNDSDSDELTVTGADTECSPDDNLVMKAVRKLRESSPFPPLRLHLHKAIPSGAGLGGGSSDAAYALKAIDRHFNLDTGREKLLSLALELGSDCPFFIDSLPALARGRGEILTPAGCNLQGLYMVLLNPGVKVSTAEAYRNCKPAPPGTGLETIYKLPVEEWKGLLTNDFEDFAISLHPVIGDIKEALYKAGAVFSLMSGSGSSVYGIFRKKTPLPNELLNYIKWEGMLQTSLTP